MKISMVYSPAPREVREWAFELPEGSKLAQALESSGIFQLFPGLKAEAGMFGIWGKRATLGHLLHAGDRIEVYRRLRVDPKVARRERFKRQGTKSAGLFAALRSGGKAGY